MSSEVIEGNAPASPQALGDFYGAIDDLVSLAGIVEYTRVDQFLTAPRNKFLQTADDEVIELRFCRSNTLEVSVDDAAGSKAGYFLFYIDEAGVVTAEMNDAEQQGDSVRYFMVPLSLADLFDLEKKIASAGPPINELDEERSVRQLGEEQAEFARKAELHELARYLDLTDAVIRAALGSTDLENGKACLIEQKALLQAVISRPE